MRRDEKTAIAHLYYENLPKMRRETPIIILDPMIATGGTAVATLEILTKRGITQDSIVFAGVIAAPEGIAQVKKHFPNVTLIIAVTDEKLNDAKFILPGLGDFGDRYFGTE